MSYVVIGNPYLPQVRDVAFELGKLLQHIVSGTVSVHDCDGAVARHVDGDVRNLLPQWTQEAPKPICMKSVFLRSKFEFLKSFKTIFSNR